MPERFRDTRLRMPIPAGTEEGTAPYMWQPNRYRLSAGRERRISNPCTNRPKILYSVRGYPIESATRPDHAAEEGLTFVRARCEPSGTWCRGRGPARPVRRIAHRIESRRRGDRDRRRRPPRSERVLVVLRAEDCVVIAEERPGR